MFETEQCCEEIQIPLRLGNIRGSWYGNRKERPILALHGWQDNAGSYALLAPLLSQHVAMLAIDLPGHGRSSHHPPGIMYHTFVYVTAIKEIMEHFKWPKVSLIGHSMGAALSYHFTCLFPQLVDILISIDVMHTRYHPIDIQIRIFDYSVEKMLIETERTLQDQKPPTYSFNQLEQLLHEASEKSIDVDKTKYILKRNITTTAEANDKFYFSRDNRIKYLFEANTEPGLCFAMAQKLGDIKWLVLKAENSYHIDEDFAVTRKVLNFVKNNNPDFSYHVIPGVKHHCHLNNAETVADYILPFLKKHRKPEICDNSDVNHAICKL